MTEKPKVALITGQDGSYLAEFLLLIQAKKHALLKKYGYNVLVIKE